MEEAAFDIILPVLEASVIYASHYCKACGRSTVTAKDIEYGLKYAAMTSVGKYIGTLFPEDEDEEDSSDEEGSSDSDGSVEVVDDTDEPFTRYTGDEDETCVQINNAYDAWDSWEPYSPAERAIKNAIEKQNGRIHTE